MTSPSLCTFPVLVSGVVPQFLHLGLLDFVEERIVLVALFGASEDLEYFLETLAVCLSMILICFLQHIGGFFSFVHGKMAAFPCLRKCRALSLSRTSYLP